MLNDKKQLLNLINDVKENKLESLDLLHYHFKEFISKYAYKYGVDIPTLTAEFDLILVYIINKEITEPKKILSYLTLCFKHFKNLNIDKFFRGNKEFIQKNIEDFENVLLENSILDEVIDNEYEKLSNIFSDDILEILKEKFIDELTCKKIGEINNLSKQRISQKILSAKKILKDELNYV